MSPAYRSPSDVVLNAHGCRSLCTGGTMVNTRTNDALGDGLRIGDAVPACVVVHLGHRPIPVPGEERHGTQILRLQERRDGRMPYRRNHVFQHP